MYAASQSRVPKPVVTGADRFPRCLPSAPEKHRELKLERVHILARDDDTRILQYQSRDASVNVTHIVPYGSIPWTSRRSPRRVSFLQEHVVTVSDAAGYHVYHIDPNYKFDSMPACTRFQSTLRERTLCKAFEAVEITEGNTVWARRQMIKFWQRKRRNELTVVTMTYYPNSLERSKHREVDLVEYSATVKNYSPLFRRQTESATVDIVPSGSARRVVKALRVKFESATGTYRSCVLAVWVSVLIILFRSRRTVVPVMLP